MGIYFSGKATARASSGIANTAHRGMPGLPVPALTEGVSFRGSNDCGGKGGASLRFFFWGDEDAQDVEGHFLAMLWGDVLKDPIHFLNDIAFCGSAVEFQDVAYARQVLVPLRLRKQCPACLTVYDLNYHRCDLRRR